MRITALQLQIFNGNQCLAIDCRKELYAGIDSAIAQWRNARRPFVIVGRFSQHHGAGTAVALSATLFAAAAAEVLAQVIQHSTGGRDGQWHFMQLAVQQKADRPRRHRMFSAIRSSLCFGAG
jgi:hypothetical protein